MKSKQWITLLSCLALLASATSALANNPFSIGISEAGGAPTGLFGWILAQQIAFEQALTKEVHAVVISPYAAITLAGLSFIYGVFHAAGPGHGKAVITSYMIVNEQALRRGLILSFLAALMQGFVAIVLVGVLALLFHATAQTLQATAHGVEIMAFAGIALLGAWLSWQRGWPCVLPTPTEFERSLHYAVSNLLPHALYCSLAQGCSWVQLAREPDILTPSGNAFTSYKWLYVVGASNLIAFCLSRQMVPIQYSIQRRSS